MSLLNKTKVRDYAFLIVKDDRPAMAGRITRVSESFFNAIEAHTRNAIVNRVRTMPSMGKTLR